MRKFLILDILKLRDGKTAAEAAAYFETAKPVMERYNLKRSDVPLMAMKALRGLLPREERLLAALPT